jgi:phosphate transport system substrate-binding protein
LGVYYIFAKDWRDIMLKKFLLCLSVLLAVFLAAACMPAESGGGGNTVVVAGSTTVTPVMRELAAEFEAACGIVIEVQELGTSAGINATISGVSEIAMASRAITQDEIAQGLSPVAIAIDGVAVIVNGSNPVANLSLEQITAIFKGEISNWSEVGGNDAPITVVSREEGSGIRQTFQTFAEIDEPARSAIFSQGTGAVIAAVSGNANAIGYVSCGVVTDGFRAVAINGVEFSEEAVINGDYIFANTFFIGVRGNISENAQAFVDFILSEAGQNIVSNKGYVRIR